MKKIAFLFLIAISVWACASDSTTSTTTSTDTASPTIEQLEAALEKDNSEASAKALITAYNKYIAEHPEDIENNARYAYRAGTVFFRMNRFIAATQQLEKGIKNYYSASITPQAADLLGSIYNDHMGDAISANTVWQSMAASFPNYEGIDKITEKIKDKDNDLVASITEMGRQMYENNTGRIDYQKGAKFINNCEVYAALQPNTEAAPSMLYKAAEAAKTLKMYEKATTNYNWIYTKYPEFEKYPQALFMYAFTLDSDMKKIDEARALYQEFIEKFPDNDFADDAQFLIDNLGKTEEEIINNFEANKKK